MARISFTSEVEELLGKLGGSVIQDSYFGLQVRTASTPRNPQTQLSQLRRGYFGFISETWRSLTTPEQDSWITAAGTIPAALRLFIGNNINLVLTDNDIIRTYNPGVTPIELPLAITFLDTTSFLVQAQTAVTEVPTAFALLLFATDLKKPNISFINQSEYQPIATFLAGTDFSIETEVLPYWETHYGMPTPSKYLCIKTAMINLINGDRADSPETCTVVPPVASDFIIDSDGTFVIDSDSSKIIAYE